MHRVVLFMLVLSFGQLSAGCLRLGFGPLDQPDDGGAPWDHRVDLAQDQTILDQTILDQSPLDQSPLDQSPLDQSPLDQSSLDAPRDQQTPDAGTVTHSWSKAFGGGSADYGYGVAVGPTGDVFITGRFQGTTSFGGSTLTSKGGYDLFVASYTAAGVHRWSKHFGAAGDELGFDVAVDVKGNVTVIGNFDGTTNLGGSNLPSVGSDDVFVASYTAAGAHRWSKAFGGSSLDQGRALGVDKSGNIYITGHFEGKADFGGPALTSAGSADIFVASYTAAGTHRWSRRHGGSGSDLGRCFAMDSQGHVMLTGAFSGTVDFGGGSLVSLGGTDIFVVSYTAAGLHRWSRRLGGKLEDKGRSITMDGSDNYTITGRFADTVDFGGGKLTSAGDLDIFVASYTASGKHRWSKRFGDATYDYANSVIADPAGNVFVTGEFSGKVDFGGGPLKSAGGADIFIASYTSSGAHRLSLRYGASAADHGRAVAMGLSDDVFVTGEFSGKVDFGGGGRTSSGGMDIFLLRLKK